MVWVARLPLLPLCAALGCSGGPVTPDAEPGFAGGAVKPPGCEYTVTTWQGAEAPAVADGVTVGDDPTPMQLRLGVAADPARSITVGWRTADSDTQAAELRYGAAEPTTPAVPLTWRYRDRVGDTYRMFEAHLCGLEPDTTYQYRVLSGGVESETFSFRTAPDIRLQPEAEVVIAVVGDTRVNTAVLGDLLALADEVAAPDLLVFTGDAVQRGTDQDLWDAFLDAGAPLFRRVPSILTIGNHEDGDQVFNTTWAMPGDERWFGIDYGAAHFTVLDDSSTFVPDETGAGRRFLAADLAAPHHAPWRIVVHHQPIYSASIGGHGPTEQLQEQWLPLIDEHTVDLVLAGHDHTYQRSHPLRAGQLDPAGTTFVVSAGGGAPLYTVEPEWWTASVASAYHIIILRVRRQLIRATVYDLAGSVIDSFLLQAPLRVQP
jgi:acid phosphatase type 7